VVLLFFTILASHLAAFCYINLIMFNSSFQCSPFQNCRGRPGEVSSIKPIIQRCTAELKSSQKRYTKTFHV